MDRDALIKNVERKIKLLPDIKINGFHDFADFLLSKIDDKVITEGIQKLTSNSKAFDFLKDEENLYSVNDLHTSIS